MKKYLFGLLAIVIAIGVVAFTIPKDAPRVDVFFKYNLTTYTEAQVENPANWVEVSDLSTGCNGINHKACRIKVNSTITEGTPPNRTMKFNAVINMAYYQPCDSWYVIAGGDVISFKNKSCN